jgi:hypothetical protein
MVSNIGDLALARSFAVIKGADDCVGDIESHHAIAEVDRCITRCTVDGSKEAGNTRGRLHQVVVHRLAGVGTAGAVADGGAVDDAGIDGANVFIVQAEPLHSLGAHIADQHVGLLGERKGVRLALGRFEVEHDTAFIAVGLQEQRSHAGVPPRTDPAHGVTGLGFDLDHIRAQISQQLGGRWPHDDGGQVQHPYARQRPGRRRVQFPIDRGCLADGFHGFASNVMLFAGAKFVSPLRNCRGLGCHAQPAADLPPRHAGSLRFASSRRQKGQLGDDADDGPRMRYVLYLGKIGFTDRDGRQWLISPRSNTG